MEATKQHTIGQWLEQLADTDTSGERDDTRMQNLLRRVGFPQAICTCGIVYFDGRGTIEAPPMPIQSAAKVLIEATNKGR